MRILIAGVGRAKSGPARDLVETYRRRIAWPITVKEVEERRRLPAEEMKAREAELLLDALPRKGDLVVVALDERGAQLSSMEFTRRLQDWRDRGISEIAFLIGGADGLAQAVTTRAELMLSLGPMTWPHLLVRGLLMEQIYRAQQILSGHPYHRE